MLKKLVFVLLLILFSIPSKAQLYKSHDWDATPTYVEISEDEKQLSSIAIKEKYLIQYFYPVIGKTFRLFQTKQNIIRINTDKGIERHNRIYIPTYNVKKVIDIKARVLKPDGSVIVLNKDNIKELENVKDYGNFKIFAIEGVTKGSQVEVLYTLELNPSGLGTIVAQKDYDVKDAEIIIRKPRNLKIRIKSYNEFPPLSLKDVEGNKEAYTATMYDIPAMTDEKSAAPEANRAKVAYQVTYSYNENESWERLANNIQQNYMYVNSKKQKKLLKDYNVYKDNAKPSNASEIINTICKYVTNNYTIVRQRNDDLDVLKNVVNKKKGTELGIIRLYAALFSYEKIDYQMVLTSDRFVHTFDPYFFSNSNLADLYFYIKSEEKFINPAHVNARLLFPPRTSLSNEAIFIGMTDWDFKTIEVPSSSKTLTKRDFSIKLSTEDLAVKVNTYQELTGYRGDMMRGVYDFLSKKDIEEFKDFAVISGIEEATVNDFSVLNEDFSLSTSNQPFIIDANYVSESMIETAGAALILKYGVVIGKQSELYQEGERVNPVMLDFLNRYEYDIKIEVPEGYTPNNLEDIIINKVIKNKDKIICQFKSSYTFDDGVITIKVLETYDEIALPLKDYEDYKSVVNAAYDFSQKSIIFEKI